MISSPIHVLHVVNSLQPGGMENGIVNLAHHLPPRLIHTSVACLEQPGSFAERLPSGCVVHLLGKGDAFTMAAVERLRAVIQQTRPQILHTHNLGPLIYAVLAAGARTAGPVILQGEHAELDAEELRIRRLWQRRVLYRAVACVHTVSDSLRRQLQRTGLRARHMEVLRNGVDVEWFKPGDGLDARRKLGLPASAQVIGLVGRFGPYKRHDFLLDAFGRVAAGNPGVHLLLVGGGGPEEGRVRALVAQHPQRERIHVCGLQRDLRCYYQAMNLLVIPSLNEGLSNVLLEAMAMGIPSLAHDACGNSEIILDGVTGRVMPMTHAGELAEAIARSLLEPEKLVAMGQASRVTTEREHSIDRMMERYTHLYERLTVGRGTMGQAM